MNQDEPIRNKVPNPEVFPGAKRRRFSAEYKLRIVGMRVDWGDDFDVTVAPAVTAEEGLGLAQQMMQG